MLNSGQESAVGVRITMSPDADGQPVQLCHFCQAAFARFGAGDEAWVG